MGVYARDEPHIVVRARQYLRLSRFFEVRRCADAADDSRFVGTSQYVVNASRKLRVREMTMGVDQFHVGTIASPLPGGKVRAAFICVDQ